MKPEIMAVLGILAGFIILEILFTRFFKKPGQTRSDAIVEIVGSGMLVLVTQPLILMTAGLTLLLSFMLFAVTNDLFCT